MSIVGLSLRNRIYLSLILLVVISFLIIGAITIWYTHIENERYHNQRLSRKERAITVALNYFLEDREEEAYGLYTRKLREKIVELADINGLDVMLYDLNGHWISSSSFKFFDQGILPEQIEQKQLALIQKSNGHLVQKLKVDGETFLTAYNYLRGARGEPIALISIPYFAQDQIQKEETFELLYTLGEIYMVLMIVALVVAFLLSNYITRGLQVVISRIRSVSLTGENVELYWDKDDEIGELIKEYNRKVRELKESVELLAKSEREGAWREMARQVAHEIKNPLTPMKLSVQQLERSWKDGREDFEQRMNRFTATMSEQIDTLSNIATEFSSFAQLNQSNPERVHLSSIIENTIKLYENGAYKITFSNMLPNTEAEIYMDKTHLQRVLNNVISNAVESIPEDKSGSIEIFLSDAGKQVLLEIQDNGCGIETSQLTTIFEPNFTTKTTGTGLGLAMVKGMMETAKGSIVVTSKISIGSTFKLYFCKP